MDTLFPNTLRSNIVAPRYPANHHYCFLERESALLAEGEGDADWR
jgi:hypothetical protein